MILQNTFAAASVYVSVTKKNPDPHSCGENTDGTPGAQPRANVAICNAEAPNSDCINVQIWTVQGELPNLQCNPETKRKKRRDGKREKEVGKKKEKEKEIKRYLDTEE